MADQNGQNQEPSPAGRAAKPFVKWAGGKRSILPALTARLPSSFNSYFEPFVGGGALFFSLAGRLSKASLSDLNVELAITYKVVQKMPEDLIRQLHIHTKNHAASPKEYFNQVRAKDVNSEEYQKRFSEPLDVAARLIYLNKCCYNGIYRVNNSGRFNAPWNKNLYFRFCEDSIRAASQALNKANARITSKDFRKIKPQSGDFVYCDPPYDQTFDQYTKDKFSEESQRELAQIVQKWAKEGVKVMLSNSDTELIQQLYRKFHIGKVQASRPINSDGTARGAIEDVIITTY